MARLARLSVLACAVIALAASATTHKSASTPPPAVGAWNAQPPASQPMDPAMAQGLWKTTFGAVKIESDAPNHVHGVWTYDRQGTQVIGYFGGPLDGNVLRLTWREPAQPTPGVPSLTGEGWLVFDPQGARFAGNWWTTTHDRQGPWSGTRGGAAQPTQPPPPPPTGYYGGAGYGGDGYGYPPPPVSPAPTR